MPNEADFDGLFDLSPFNDTLQRCLHEEVELQKRCERNRKRSKRRGIFCPIHGCYIHSVSKKHPLYADRAEHLQARGVGRRSALLAVATQTTVSLTGEWLEAFWCDQCQTKTWYHVRRSESNHYDVSITPPELWQQATGVINPHGNPSVSEFTQKCSRKANYHAVKEFHFMR